MPAKLDDSSGGTLSTTRRQHRVLARRPRHPRPGDGAGDERRANREELRRAIEALSKHDPKLEKRLTDRVDVLADRLATLGSTLSTTAAALAGRTARSPRCARSSTQEQAHRVLGARADEERQPPRSSSNFAPPSGPPRPIARRARRGSDSDLGTKVNFLAERVDTLGQTVATTAAGLAGRDGELATLRQRLEETSTRIERTAASTQVRGRDSGRRARRAPRRRRATSARLAAREDEIAAVRARIDEAYARIGTVVTELRASIATSRRRLTALDPLPATTGEALDARTAESTSARRARRELASLAAISETVNQALRRASSRRLAHPTR